MVKEVKRYELINHLIETYNLVNYLEIGVFTGECIEAVKAPHKDGIDPGKEGVIHPKVNYPITSDEFFKMLEPHPEIKYDICFIDGLHHADQVTKDIHNCLKHLQPQGFVLLHDCNPATYEAQLVPRQTSTWNGDVWKAFCDFKLSYKGYKCWTVDTDQGVGIIRNSEDKKSTSHNKKWEYEDFDKHRKEYLNLISVDEFKSIFK